MNLSLCPTEGFWGMLAPQDSRAGSQQTKALQFSLQKGLDQTRFEWLASGVQNNNRLLQGYRIRYQFSHKANDFWPVWALGTALFLRVFGKHSHLQQSRPKIHSCRTRKRWLLKMAPDSPGYGLGKSQEGGKGCRMERAGLPTEHGQSSNRKKRSKRGLGPQSGNKGNRNRIKRIKIGMHEPPQQVEVRRTSVWIKTRCFNRKKIHVLQQTCLPS